MQRDIRSASTTPTTWFLSHPGHGFSRVEIRNQLTFERRDHVFEKQLALFEAADAKLIHHRVVLKPADQVVEIPVTDAQLTESFKFLEAFSFDFVGHFDFMLLAVGQQRQPITIRCTNNDEPRVKDVLFRVIGQKFAVKFHDRTAGLLDHSLRGRGIPL